MDPLPGLTKSPLLISAQPRPGGDQPLYASSLFWVDMARISSREAALARRKALSTDGKSAAQRYARTVDRVHRGSPAARTDAAAARPVVTARSTARTPVAAAPARATPAVAKIKRSIPPAGGPSRALALQRRQALSSAGKRADTSKDRIRSTDRKPLTPATSASPADRKPCSCQQAGLGGSAGPLPTTRLTSASRSVASAGRSTQVKGRAVHSPGRMLVLARREAQSKRGKAASLSARSAAATIARQTSPDLTSRELAQKVRELKARTGAASGCQVGGKRPCGPRRGHNRPVAAAQDANWKVGASETSSGQVVTGTRTDRSASTTGNEPSTCRTITGTEYMGADVFRTYCGSEAPSTRPAKVSRTATGYGNAVTGNEVGRSSKVTGDEPGTCKAVTGTQYIPADQAEAWCGSPGTPMPRKTGLAQTYKGETVSGTLVGRSGRVTGDEPGSARQLTGTQYLAAQPHVGKEAPAKVNTLTTLSGTAVTGTAVGRSSSVTGDEPGSCRNVTGDQYLDSNQFAAFCNTTPQTEAAKVGFSITNRLQTVSGTEVGRSEKVTGDEPGTCKTVTGTPYLGLDNARWCSTAEQREVQARTPLAAGSPGHTMTGQQPGIGGVMTGAAKGACDPITGTPYVGTDQFTAACGSTVDGDFPQPLDTPPWTRFSVQSPAAAAHVARQRSSEVTGTTYEQGSRITGPFDLGTNKVTGTEQFRFDRRQPRPNLGPVPASAPAPAMAPAPSRVTGEGREGLHITGNDWGRNDRVTGTEGPSARRRNPSRPGPMSAMPPQDLKRNEAVPLPESRVTGSSGNTASGSLVTYSGGARG